MDSGIYRLGLGDAFYIGQSLNLTKRRKQHLKALCAGAHHNHRVQRAFYDEAELHWTILERVPPEELNEREQAYLDLSLHNPRCLNIAGTAQTSRPQTGPEDFPAKLRKAKRNPEFDHTEYTWTHPQHGTIRATQYEMRMKWKIYPGDLLHGHADSVEGWSIIHPLHEIHS